MNTMSKLDKIKTCINGWNVNKYSAESRNALRDLLGWKANDEETGGATLADLIEQEFYSAYEDRIMAQRPPQQGTTAAVVASLPTSTIMTSQARQYRQIVVDVVEGRKAYFHACEAILASPWNLIDPGGLMKKDPEQVRDFLNNCSIEVGMFNDMFATRRNLLKMIFDAWLRWAVLLKQEA